MSNSIFKICIITHTHLSRNPRVVKEAIALTEAGYNVHILNSIYSKALATADLNLLNNATVPITHVSDLSKNNLRSFYDRAVKKIAHLLIRYFDLETRYALGYAPNRYVRMSNEIKADLYICHQELPLYVGNELLRKRLNVAFDIEDWHSEDLLRDAMASRPIRLLRRLEYGALKNGKYCTTTSNALASQLAIKYKVRLPEVIYNCFPVDRTILNKNKRIKFPIKLVWFSLNIGKGRGLEEIIKILNKIDVTIELHLIGEIDHSYKEHLNHIIKGKFNVFFHPIVPTEQMNEQLSKYDIGLAIELRQPKNREFTITNKFFQYVQAGLPVIVTNTVGQEEIFKKFKPGLLIDFGKEDYSDLKKWLNSLEELNAVKKRTNTMALFYDWKIQKIKLLKLVRNALS